MSTYTTQMDAARKGIVTPQLKEQGVINEEEYEKMKADCLAKL